MFGLLYTFRVMESTRGGETQSGWASSDVSHGALVFLFDAEVMNNKDISCFPSDSPEFGKPLF